MPRKEPKLVRQIISVLSVRATTRLPAADEP